MWFKMTFQSHDKFLGFYKWANPFSYLKQFFAYHPLPLKVVPCGRTLILTYPIVHGWIFLQDFCLYTTSQVDVVAVKES